MSMSLKPIHCILTHLEVPFDNNNTVNQLHHRLHSYVSHMQKASSAPGTNLSWKELFADMVQSHEHWPQLILSSAKERIRDNFLKMTSSTTLKAGVCVSCAEHSMDSCLQLVKASRINIDLLQHPDAHQLDDPVVEPCLDPEVVLPVLPFTDGPLAGALLDTRGVSGQGAETVLALYKDCSSALRCDCVPDLALCNHLFLGDIPPQLSDLSIVEESMISLCCAKCCIVQLKADGQEYASHSAQHGIKGNLIIYPQRPSDIAWKLLPSVDDITSPICVLFIGAHAPSMEWLRDKAKPLAVHGYKVRQALQWLKTHNRLYKDIEIDKSVLSHLDTNPVLPFHVEHIPLSHATEVSTSGYVESGSSAAVHDIHTDRSAETDDIPFSSVVITDVDNVVSSSQLAAAAIHHMKRKGSSFLQIPHDLTPVNEFFNANLFPMLYPTLYPYGIGGFEDRNW